MAGRRDFLKIFLEGGIFALAAAVFYPLVRFIIPPELPEANPLEVVAARTDELSPNSGKIFPFGKTPAILIRTPKGEYRAFSAVCTHLQCTVQYRSDLEHIWCACHNGHYDLFGTNIAGPPPRPLQRYVVAIRGDKIYVRWPTS